MASASGKDGPRYQQMSPGEMLSGQMSLGKLTSVKDGPRKLTLKVGPNQVSKVRFQKKLMELSLATICLYKGRVQKNKKK